MQGLLDQFSLLKSETALLNMNKGYRILQRIAYSLKSGSSRHILLSDALCMIELLRRWTCIDSTTSSIDSSCTTSEKSMREVDKGSVSDTPYSECSPADRSGKIRGESLRCLYYLIRALSDDLVGQWVSLLADSSSGRGLCGIAVMDPDVHARRFALYCVMSLFRSESCRRLIPKMSSCIGRIGVNRFPTYSVSADMADALPMVFDMLLTFLNFEDVQDVSSISFVLQDFLLVVAHKSRAPILHKIHERICSMIFACNLEEGIVSRLLFALAKLSSFETTNSEMLNSNLITLCERYNYACSVVWAVNCVLAETLVDGTCCRVIKSGLDCIVSTSEEVSPEILQATLYNIAALENSLIDRTLVETLKKLISLPLSPKLLEIRILGLGKISRKSALLTQEMLCLDDQLHGDILHVNPSNKQIQGMGDLFFSAVLQNLVGSSARQIWRRLIDWTVSADYCAVALRTIMTGLSRLQESKTDFMFAADIEDVLMKIWTSAPQGTDRLLADSIRTIGLLAGMPASPSFALLAQEQLGKSIDSAKTQLVLSGISSINQLGKSASPNRWTDQLSQLVIKIVRDLSVRTYFETAATAGALHMLHDSLTCLCGNEDSLPTTISGPIRNILECKEITKLAVHNEQIAKHLHGIRKFIN